MNNNYQNYKKIIKRHGHELSDEDVYSIAKNISELAEVILEFEKRKKKPPPKIKD